MSYRSRRSSDHSPHRDKNHSHYSSNKYEKYDKYEYRHRKDDLKGHYEHRHDTKRSSHVDRSKRDKSHSSYHRYSRSRSKSPVHSSRHSRERSNYKSKDYRELSESSSSMTEREYTRNSRESSTYGQCRTHGAPQANDNNSSDKSQPTCEKESIGSSNEKYYMSNITEDAGGLKQTTNLSNTFGMDADSDPALLLQKEKIQRETQLRLQKHLENEGKLHSWQKPQAAHPIFANDGSFLEMFKSMQGQLQQTECVKPATVIKPVATTPISNVLPIASKRRGGKILKTGIVQKQRIVEDDAEVEAQDSWAAYLNEVKRYKNVTCNDDNITRSLVK